MFSGGLAPQQPPVINSSLIFGDSLNTFTNLFTNPSGNQFNLQQLLAQKTKLKRCRQRVDAGEPRNSYQNQLKMNGYKRERSSSATSDNGIKLNDCENEPEEILSSKAKRIKLDEDDQDYNEVDQREIDEMLDEQKDTDQNSDNDSVQQCHSNTSSISNSSSRRKSFHPQRQITDQNNSINDNDFNNVESVGGDPEESSIVGGNESPIDFPDENETTTEQSSSKTNISQNKNNSNYLLNMMNILQQQQQQQQQQQNLQQASSSSSSNINNNPTTSKLQELLEAQKRFNLNNSDNKEQSSSTDKPFNLAHLQQQQSQDFNHSVNRLKQNLKDEISTVIEKVVQEYRMQELRKLMENIFKTMQFSNEMQQQMNDIKQQQQRFAAAAAASFLMPKNINYNGNQPPSMPPFNTSAVSNFLAAAAAANQNNQNSANCSSNSIFPTQQSLANLSAITNQLNNNQLLRTSTSNNDCSLRKKRSKVTDSLRINKTGIVRDSTSLPTSERSSPLTNNYFPPTMVSHPLYNTPYSNDDKDRDDSGENSDNYSDTGPYDGTIAQSSTLTPIHLRKAKLMFFYTRYPSSALLKSYFPDIRFNKNNTAQLVKWFSNFREFFYMQMEKYAKQALAEGIEDRNQIIVTEDSEIYKTLNQHYNRNNLFPPPPRLRYVIEETLREFFTALQQKKDSEPSWKKQIYKIINQMDDPIPEHFKHPSFMNSLE